MATTRLSAGSTVTLTVSDGPGDAIVPDDLIGMSLIDARSALTAVGLLVSQTVAMPSDQPQGTVLEVLPPVGSVTEAGSSVILTIAPRFSFRLLLAGRKEYAPIPFSLATNRMCILVPLSANSPTPRSDINGGL